VFASGFIHSSLFLDTLEYIDARAKSIFWKACDVDNFTHPTSLQGLNDPV
jgi:hypothetical protein